jgi:hypothetical protein
MVCTCGARLPADSRYSICAGCLRGGDEFEGDGGIEDTDEPCEECDGEGCDICQPDEGDDLHPEFDDPMTYGDD